MIWYFKQFWCYSVNLTGVVDLPGVKVIEEWHHQALAQVDLHKGHCHILPALNRGHLLQHGQSTAFLHLERRGCRLWHVADIGNVFLLLEDVVDNCGLGWGKAPQEGKPSLDVIVYHIGVRMNIFFLSWRINCDADLCRGDDRLHQKVN